MSINYDAGSQSRYSDHFGHLAWQFYSKSVEGAVIEDLFWRMVQTDPDFAVAVARTVWPKSERMKGELLLNTNLSMSLWPESCGAYTFGGWCGLYCLNGGASDTKHIEQGVRRADRGGYYPGPLVAMHTGWLPQNVVPNLLHEMGKRLSVSDRFRFSVKANHRQVPMGKALTEDEVQAILKNVCPAACDLFFQNVYWYKRECGDINYGIIYIRDYNGKLYKFPLSAWESDTIADARPVYDMLNIATPYPLYDLDMLVRNDEAQYALICDSEATVEYIKRYFAWIPHLWPVTTYTAMDGTNWNPLRGKTPIIFPEATEHGIRMALRLGEVLVKHGFSPRFLRRQRCSGRWSAEYIQDLGQLAYKDGECSLPEFAEHSLREFGVQPPAGILPKAIPLSALPEPTCAPEPLMDGLLDVGELMMVYAWRGIGKSLFAMLLALCFVSGKSALNGRICPTRKYKVLVLDGELSSHILKKRGRALCCGHGLPLEANDELVVRSSVVEDEKLEMETNEGFKDLEADMEAADIIIVDSVFKFFPSAMSPDYDATAMLQERLDWARKHEKTMIVIDHEGKASGTSYGSMGKEISLDSALRLHCTKKNTIQATVQKVRNHAQPIEAYLEMRIVADEKGEKITILDAGESMADANIKDNSSGLDSEYKSPKSPAGRTALLDEAIKEYVREQPDAAQGVIVTALMDRGYGGRSTIQARIKVLSEGGQLPAWKSRPRTHKVAEQPAPEGDQN